MESGEKNQTTANEGVEDIEGLKVLDEKEVERNRLVATIDE